MQTSSTNQDIIYLNNFANYWEIGNFTLQNSAFTPYFSSASVVPTGGDAIRINYCGNGYLHDLQIFGFYGGIYFTTSENSYIQRILIQSTIDHAIALSDLSGVASAGCLNVDVSDVTAFGSYSVASSIPPYTPYVAYSEYGLLIAVYGTTQGTSFNEGCQFYNCSFMDFQLAINVVGTDFSHWRNGSSGGFTFVKCIFDFSQINTKLTNNSLNYLRDSQFIGCYFGGSVYNGVDLINTDALEFNNCQIDHNDQHGMTISNSTTNLRIIGGEVRNNSLLTGLMYDGIVVNNAVTGLVILGVLLGDFPTMVASPSFTTPSQRYGIYVLSDGSSNFIGKYVIISNNLLGIQPSGSGTAGGIALPMILYPATVSIINNY